MWVSNSWGFVDDIPIPATARCRTSRTSQQRPRVKGALVLFAAGKRRIRDPDTSCKRRPRDLRGRDQQRRRVHALTNFGNAVDLVAPRDTLTTDISGAAGATTRPTPNLFGGTVGLPGGRRRRRAADERSPDKTAEELTASDRQHAAAPFAVPDANGHDPVYGYGILDPPAALARGAGSAEGRGRRRGRPWRRSAAGSATAGTNGSGCDCRAASAPGPLARERCCSVWPASTDGAQSRALSTREPQRSAPGLRRRGARPRRLHAASRSQSSPSGPSSSDPRSALAFSPAPAPPAPPSHAAWIDARQALTRRRCRCTAPAS